MRSKYHAVKLSTPDGVFDSKREYNRWLELKMLQRAGKISELERQVEYILLPSQRYEGGTEKPVRYIADFRYFDEHGDLVVEDTKGVKTKDYILKRKMMLYFWDIHIREV